MRDGHSHRASSGLVLDHLGALPQLLLLGERAFAERTAIDGGHLFGDNTALVAVRRGSYLRGSALSFIRSLAPSVSSEEILRKVIGS